MPDQTKDVPARDSDSDSREAHTFRAPGEPQEHGPLPKAHESARAARESATSPQTLSPSYKLAFQDNDFLLRDELRPVRLQLELLKPELLQAEHRIASTIVVFGSARLPEPSKARRMVDELRAALTKRPGDAILSERLIRAERALANSRYYDEARLLGRLVSRNCQDGEYATLVVTTGGGGGIMEAANRGAYDEDALSIGHNIVLPHEQLPNRYITPQLSFQFHYFAIRKMHFLMRAKGLVVFPGGFGTLDELFDALTLLQTAKIEPLPVLLFGEEYWRRVLSFETLMEEGMISPQDLELFTYVETAWEAWTILAQRNNLPVGSPIADEPAAEPAPDAAPLADDPTTPPEAKQAL